MNFAETFDFGRVFEDLSLLLNHELQSLIPLIELDRKLKQGLEMKNDLTTRIINLLERLLPFVQTKQNLSPISDEIKNFMEAERTILKISDHSKFIEEFIGLNDELTQRLLIWEERILSDLSNIKFLEFQPKTNLNLERLFSGAKSFFENAIWDKLSRIEQEDLTDGCRCILLQAWTPSAMITVRAIEAALRCYYQKITGYNAGKKTWGNLLEDLWTHPKADKKLLGYFDHLNDIRNRLQHPKARVSHREAEDIFNQAIYVMNLIHKSER